MGEGRPLFYEVNLVEHFVKSGDIWRKGRRSKLKIQSAAATAAERKSRLSSSFLDVQWVGTALRRQLTQNILGPKKGRRGHLGVWSALERNLGPIGEGGGTVAGKNGWLVWAAGILVFLRGGEEKGKDNGTTDRTNTVVGDKRKGDTSITRVVRLSDKLEWSPSNSR